MIVPSVLRRLQGLVRSIRDEEEGQALVEYALLISLVTVVAFISVQAFGLGVSHLYSKINTNFP
jgi:Flp pilus assembly pilin Flp